MLLERCEGSSEQKYKLVCKILGILTNILAGAYVPFGIFKVYSDPCFTDSLTVALAMLRTIAHSELVAYHKLQEQAYEFLEQLHKSCLSLVFTALPSSVYLTAVDVICTGLRLDNIKSCLNCANSIQYLCECVIKQARKNTGTHHTFTYGRKPSEEHQGIQRTLQERPSVFTELLTAVLEVVMTEDTNYMWTLSKPLLGLIIISEQQYEQLRVNLINTLTHDPERSAAYHSAFELMMKNITRSMDIKNKDRFTKNFSDFRLTFK
jgi:exportin-7